MSSPSSPMPISAQASCTLRISSNVHSAPSNSGLTFTALRLGSFTWVTATASFSPPALTSRRGVVGGEQFVEDRVDVLRRRHAACGEVLVPPRDLGIAVPDRRLVRVGEPLAVGRLNVGEVLADGQHVPVEQTQAARHVVVEVVAVGGLRGVDVPVG